MKIEDLREEINKIDDEMSDLFFRRMEVVEKVAQYKKENGLPIVNMQREREILANLSDKCEKLETYTRSVFNTIMDVSRSYQETIINEDSPMRELIRGAMKNTEFPKKATVACQGIDGAYAQLACDKIFSLANIMYFKNFDGVFNAVEKGLCKYGILPIENSVHGSVNEVYDLMRNHSFYIVRALKLRVNHHLLAKPNVKLGDIKEIISHPQAIGQCKKFLGTLPDVKITFCENTAVAARMVSESPRRDIAAISSANCAELYGLKTVKRSIEDASGNSTRFICISKEPEIYAGANKISIMLTLPHRPGALYSIIGGFYSLGLNLTKLESRPMGDSDFEFMFYFDIEASVTDEKVVGKLCELEKTLDQFVFFGNYPEM